MSDENKKKEVKKYKIAGFTFTGKAIRNMVILVAIIAAASWGSKMKKQKELEERLAAEQERIAAAEANNVPQEVLSIDEQLQRQLVERYGDPPEGFKWDFDGTLLALSDESSCEDVIYTFLRALSVLDFSTAQRYSRNSSVIAEYQDYYSDYTAGYTDYYDNFLRKQYKTSIASLEVEAIDDIAVFADGTQYVTVKIKAIDLQDKEFWRADKDNLYNRMREFKKTEDDDVKMESFLYDYIIEQYEAGVVEKRTYTVELVLSKDNAAGWLVTNDRELDAVLRFDQGNNIVDYIQSEFSDWNLERDLDEAIGGGE